MIERHGRDSAAAGASASAQIVLQAVANEMMKAPRARFDFQFMRPLPGRVDDVLRADKRIQGIRRRWGGVQKRESGSGGQRGDAGR